MAEATNRSQLRNFCTFIVTILLIEAVHSRKYCADMYAVIREEFLYEACHVKHIHYDVGPNTTQGISDLPLSKVQYLFGVRSDDL